MLHREIWFCLISFLGNRWFDTDMACCFYRNFLYFLMRRKYTYESGIGCMENPRNSHLVSEQIIISIFFCLDFAIVCRIRNVVDSIPFIICFFINVFISYFSFINFLHIFCYNLIYQIVFQWSTYFHHQSIALIRIEGKDREGWSWSLNRCQVLFNEARPRAFHILTHYTPTGTQCTYIMENYNANTKTENPAKPIKRLKRNPSIKTNI